jgi:hypothetical protein
MAAPRTVTTNIIGGLGNQLFLAANLVATAARNDARPWVAREEWSSSCDMPRPTYWDSMLKGLEADSAPPPGYDERAAHVVTDVRPVAKLALPAGGAAHHRMVGFFQSDAFFDDHAAAVRRQLLPADLAEHAARRVGALNPHGLQTVAVHARRGDYLKMADTFAVLDHGYYDEAFRTLYGRQLFKRDRSGRAPAPELPDHLGAASGHVPEIRALVFCEDKAYGRTLAGYLAARFPATHPVLVEEPRAAAAGAPPGDVSELLMMAQCDDVVMANSTFSWWGAYLNATPMRRVVAPSRWFTKEPFPASPHLYCNDWIVV